MGSPGHVAFLLKPKASAHNTSGRGLDDLHLRSPRPLMGRAQGFDGVRYVSPVTARLFSKAGHSEVLGLSAGELLAPIEADWRDRDHRQRSGQAPSREAAGEEEQAAPPLMPGQLVQQRHVEVVRPSAVSPVPSVEGLTSPQAHLELILLERVSEPKRQHLSVL